MHKNIGRYEVLGELGQGAMGIVYKGKDPRIGRVVALKTIHPGTALSKDEQKEFYERFYREAQTAGNLSHPNIVTIFDADEDREANISFIAMEFIEGQSLQQLLDGDKIFTPLETLKIVVQIAEGLAYAHRNGIIHRDIKPANVILTPENRVKITDFGIARIESSSLTRTGQFLGTPYYMAPEQIAGGQIDGRSDLFSLAVVFYQLLTREKPFSGNNITTILYKIVNQEPLPATRLNIGLSSGFDLVLMRGLAKRPEDRYQDGEQFAADLRQLLAGKPPIHAGADATLMVSQFPAAARTIDASQLPGPASTGPATAAVSAVSAPTGAAAAEVPARKSKSHAALIGFAAALTVVVVFLVGYLAFFSGRDDRPTGQQPTDTPEFLTAQGEAEIGEVAAVPGEPAAGEPGGAAEIIEPPVEQPVAAAGQPVRNEPQKAADTVSEQSTGQQTAQSRTTPPPARETPVVTAPVTSQPPAKDVPAAATRQEQVPARPQEIRQDPPAGKQTVAEPASTGPSGGAAAEGAPVETTVEPPPPADTPQDSGSLDVVFKHSFQAGRLTIRADGTEVYSKSFGGGDSGGWKGLLSKVKKTTFEDYGIQVPVGRYPLEIKVSVPGKDISPVSVSARFKADQERCLSITSKLLINRDEIEARWGCADDDEDEDEDKKKDDDEDEDKDKKKDDDA
jgi:serine/threonine-protein kinase